MVRALSILSVLWLAVSGCGPSAEPCSASTCAGCCDANGQCQSGATDPACGFGGAACSVCASGQSCQANLCAPAGSGGGTGTTGGGSGATGGGGGGGATMMTGTFTVGGRVTYDFVPATYAVATDTGTLDFARATQKPARNATVRVLEGTTVLATGSTSSDGAYSLTFTSTGAGALTVQVLAKTTTPPITVQDNTSGGAVWALGAAVPAGGGTLDVRATHGWTGSGYGPTRTAAPFAILDSMYTAATAFTAARPALQMPLLKVNWSPNNTTATNGTVEQGFLGTSYFDPGPNQIYVVGKAGVDTDEYDDHVIVHEWAHFFEANLSRSDSIGGDHSTGDELDPRDAFSEGWGDAASGILTGSPLYADTYWSGSTLDAFGWDLENEPNPTDDPTPGVFSEATVMRVLYDAWDTRSDASWDGLALGLGPLSDAFTAGHRTTTAFTTLGSFVTALKAQAGVNATAVNTLLAHSSVGPLTSDFGDGDARLRAMYTPASLPRTETATLDGRVAYNFQAQNKYWVVSGNGARISVSATSSQDVGVSAYLRGEVVGFKDDLSGGGTESFSFNSVAGQTYVITLEGYGSSNGTYTANVSLTSP